MSTASLPPSFFYAPVDFFSVDIKARRLPKVGWLKRPGRFYVKMVVDGKVQKTAVGARGDVASWAETFSLRVNFVVALNSASNTSPAAMRPVLLS